MEQQHHLAAILFTDIVGYTAMMQKDERQALTVIRKYNTVLGKLVAGHHGQVVNNYGDGSLCTFSSAINAVNCAVQIQKELIDSDPIVPLRIGLHIGEIFFEDGKAFGDGVNLASRIQSLGQPNTILFSKEIFDMTRNQEGLKSVSLGRFEFKNVDQPREVYALANDGLAIPRRENMEGKLKTSTSRSNSGARKKMITATAIIFLLLTGYSFYSFFFKKPVVTSKEKSIAVLPFNNMSNDKENEYFSDGMTEEITTQLSRIGELKVIARTSAMLYKNSKKSIREIADELGVAVILEGSVQKTENKIRITAQLIDAATQEHIWADKYDRELKDVFAIQSEVAQEIASQLHAKITDTEKQRIAKVPTTNPEAYQYYLQGYQLHQKFWATSKAEYFENSRALFEKAISLDTNYALAYAGLADLYNSYSNSYSQEDSDIISLQLNKIERAWKIDSTNDYIIYVKGSIEESTLGHTENAFKLFKKGIEINPNNPDNFWGLALLLLAELGMLDEPKLLLDRTIKLDPLLPGYFEARGICNYFLGNYEDALKDLQTAIRLQPDHVQAMYWLALTYASMGKLEDAKKTLDKFFLIRPSIDDLQKSGVAYTYAKLGNKKKALELAHDNWSVLLALGMKEDALKTMEADTRKGPANSYLTLKSQLATPDFELIKNDPRFLTIMEKRRKEYEENKRKYNVTQVIASLPSLKP